MHIRSTSRDHTKANLHTTFSVFGHILKHLPHALHHNDDRKRANVTRPREAPFLQIDVDA